MEATNQGVLVSLPCIVREPAINDQIPKYACVPSHSHVAVPVTAFRLFCLTGPLAGGTPSSLLSFGAPRADSDLVGPSLHRHLLLQAARVLSPSLLPLFFCSLSFL
jgi:hypothetical protein